MLIAVQSLLYGIFFTSDHGYFMHVTIDDIGSYYSFHHQYHNWRDTIVSIIHIITQYLWPRI